MPNSYNSNILKSGKIYFASDFHLGIPDYESSLQREKKIVSWLGMISEAASEIFLMGDIFDFWFEYKTVIPKGYVRLLGKIADLTDKGIKIHLFKGNHDIWAFNYLEKEAGVQLHRRPAFMEFDGKKFFLVHGDGLGPGDSGYKFLKKVFEFKPNQFLFKWLHPDIGARMGLYFSHKSRLANLSKEGKSENGRKTEEEMLYHYALRKTQEHPELDYLVFGHRHIPVQIKVSDHTEMFILGDWITHFSYGVFENGKMSLKFYKG